MGIYVFIQSLNTTIKKEGVYIKDKIGNLKTFDYTLFASSIKSAVIKEKVYGYVMLKHQFWFDHQSQATSNSISTYTVDRSGISGAVSLDMWVV